MRNGGKILVFFLVAHTPPVRDKSAEVPCAKRCSDDTKSFNCHKENSKYSPSDSKRNQCKVRVRTVVILVVSCTYWPPAYQAFPPSLGPSVPPYKWCLLAGQHNEHQDDCPGTVPAEPRPRARSVLTSGDEGAVGVARLYPRVCGVGCGGEHETA